MGYGPDAYPEEWTPADVEEHEAWLYADALLREEERLALGEPYCDCGGHVVSTPCLLKNERGSVAPFFLLYLVGVAALTWFVLHPFVQFFGI